MTPDERRSAALLLWPDRAQDLGREALAVAAKPFRAARTPSLPRRLGQALALRGGRLDWERDIAAPLAEARRGAGAGPTEAPVLLRVDEFPHARAFDTSGPLGTDRFRRFHAMLAEAGIPYLLAITPRVSREYLNPAATDWRPLDDSERELLLELDRDGVVFGLHGLNHRTRHRSPRRRSEFCGLPPASAAERIDAARSSLAELDLATPVFVPPFNRFDAGQYGALADRFEVICGGPEGVRLLGFGPTPAWRGNAVYMPSYPPLYGMAAEVAAAVGRPAAPRAPWSPATLHWGWEAEDELAGVRKLCKTLTGRVADWRDFLAAVDASRAA